jgi:outer membrane immunogenic protein
MSRFAALGRCTALLLAAFLGNADAADFISYSTSTNQQMPLAAPSSSVNWNGFYAGVYGASQSSAKGGAQFGGGVDLGINATFNFVLVGGEIAVQGLDGGAGTTSYAQAIGRGGILVGDNALFYGAAGYGIDTGTPEESDVLAGGGLEYALSNAVSIRAQYLHGFPAMGDNPKNQITLGAQFHF